MRDSHTIQHGLCVGTISKSYLLGGVPSSNVEKLCCLWFEAFSSHELLLLFSPLESCFEKQKLDCFEIFISFSWTEDPRGLCTSCNKGSEVGESTAMYELHGKQKYQPAGYLCWGYVIFYIRRSNLLFRRLCVPHMLGWLLEKFMGKMGH